MNLPIEIVNKIIMLNRSIYPYMKLLKFNFLYNYNYTYFTLKNDLFNQMFYISKSYSRTMENMFQIKYINIIEEVSNKKIYKKEVRYLHLFDEEYVSLCLQKGSRKTTTFEVKPDVNYLIQMD
jgi:hypothetical protein